MQAASNVTEVASDNFFHIDAALLQFATDRGLTSTGYRINKADEWMDRMTQHFSILMSCFQSCKYGQSLLNDSN